MPSPQEREIERFNPATGGVRGAMLPNPSEGGWVRYSDHQAALQDREAELERERDQAREQTEAMAWAAGWETDGCPPFDFETVRKQIIESGHEESRDYADAQERANRAETALREAREEIERFLAAEYPEGSGDLILPADRHVQRLFALLDTPIEDREPEKTCPRCHGQRRVPSQLDQGTEPCPDCKPPAPCSDRPEPSSIKPCQRCGKISCTEEREARLDLSETEPEPSSSDQEGEGPRWSEQWTLGSDTAPTISSTIALRGPEIYGQQEVEVVPKLEAEQQIERARRSTQPALPVPSEASTDEPCKTDALSVGDQFPEASEDWPALQIARVAIGDAFFYSVRHYPEREWNGEQRRYIPAPIDQKGGE